jgi:uncharacterized coiled-coil protein SlyX
MERSLSARDEYVDRRFADLESRVAAPVSATPVDPDITKRLATLESTFIDSEAAISKRLEAIESNCVVISDDDCEARVTALEAGAADVTAIVDDLKLRV